MTVSCTECPLRALDCFVSLSDKDVEAMERFKVGELSIDKKTNFFRRNPERACHLTWLAAIEEHFLGAALATVGQKSARERLAEWRDDLLSVPDLARLEDIALIDEPAVTRRPLM